MDILEIVFISAAAVSAAASGSVLLTAAMFRDMRQRMFMQIIIFISLSDFIASAASAFGYPPGNSLLCPIQSFLSTCFYRASWFWTVVLNYQLFGVVMNGDMALKTYQMHLICWSASLFCVLVPLFNTTYGRDDDDGSTPQAWCYLKEEGADETMLYIWIIVTLYVPLIVSVAMMLYWLFRIFWRFRNYDLREVNPEIYRIIDMLWYFPVALCINWVPNLVMSMLFNFNFIPETRNSVSLFNALTLLATQNGTFSAIIFFVKSKEAQYRWKHFFDTGSTELQLGIEVSDFGREDGLLRQSMTENDYIRFSDQMKDVTLRRVDSVCGAIDSNDKIIGFDRQASYNSDRHMSFNSDGDGIGWNNYSPDGEANSPFR